MNNVSSTEIKSFPKVVFWNDTEYRKAEGMFNLYVSKTGNVFLRTIDGDLIESTLHRWETSNGHYVSTNGLTDKYLRKSVLVHKLVCLAFNGPTPTNDKYDTNHINGIKNDNRAENLEWVTRSQNVQHAFDLGICAIGLRIEARNIYTKEVKNYNSISKMAREWGIKRNRLRNIVARYRKKPTDDGWIFTVDDSSDKKLNRYQQLSVVFKDYLSGDITIAESVDKATELTGILTTTIRNRLNSKAISSFSNELCSKYVFKKTDSIYVWPVYSVEEVHKSIKNHEARMKKY